MTSKNMGPESQQIIKPAKLQQPWIERFTSWAESRQDIRAAFVMGSRGRSESYTADEWSDLDVAFVTKKPGLYIQKFSWMGDIGSFWAGFINSEDNFGGLAAADTGQDQGSACPPSPDSVSGLPTTSISMKKGSPNGRSSGSYACQALR